MFKPLMQVSADVISVFMGKVDIFTLELCTFLFPLLTSLLESKMDRYVCTFCIYIFEKLVPPFLLKKPQDTGFFGFVSFLYTSYMLDGFHCISDQSRSSLYCPLLYSRSSFKELWLCSSA